MIDDDDDEMSWLCAFLWTLAGFAGVGAFVAALGGAIWLGFALGGERGAIGAILAFFGLLMFGVVMVLIKSGVFGPSAMSWRAPPMPLPPPYLPPMATPPGEAADVVSPRDAWSGSDDIASTPVAADVHGNPSRTTQPGSRK